MSNTPNTMLSLENLHPSAPPPIQEAMSSWTGPRAAGYVPRWKTKSIHEVRKIRDERVSSIFTDYHGLVDIMNRHEATIRRRWQKKKQDQRRAILLTAWNNDMASKHRPDFDFVRREIRGVARFPHYRETLMLPHINLEDLVKGDVLPLFLSSRTKYDPAHFATEDCQAMHPKLFGGLLGLVELSGYIMMFTPEGSIDRYAEILREEAINGVSDPVRSQAMTPAYGLLVLEAQEQEMTFLVNCAFEILHDISDHDLFHGAIQPAPTLSARTGYLSLADLALEAPYRPPSNIDFARIASLLAARRDEAVDHLLSLRENPDYFAACMSDSLDNSMAMIKNSNNENIFTTDHDVNWGRAIKSEIMQAYREMQYYSDLLSHADTLQYMQLRYAANIKPDADLPPAYLDELLQFRAFKGSAPVRAYFQIEKHGDQRKTRYKMKRRPLAFTFLNKVQLEFMWQCSQMWDDDALMTAMGLPALVDEVQRLMESEPQARAMVTPYVSSMLGSLSILCECLRELNMYHPWAKTLIQCMETRNDVLKADYMKTHSEPRQLIHLVLGKHLCELGQRGAPIHGRFTYPVGKRRTRENVETMRVSEYNLYRFWSYVDELLDPLRLTDASKLLLPPHNFEYTPEWQEPVQFEPENEPENGADAETTGLINNIFSNLSLDSPHQAQELSPVKSFSFEKSFISTPKIKTKTRGIATQQQAPIIPDPVPEPMPSESEPTFFVDKRTLSVFKTIFFTPDVNTMPGEVPWKDFLHAMVAVGFIPQPLGGSKWNFNPSDAKLNVSRSINFHKPHPKDKFAYEVARNIGNRLHRAFGWEGYMFALAEKGSLE